MAVLQKIREFFRSGADAEERNNCSRAPTTNYEIRPLTDKASKEVLQLNQRCFKTGENYTKYTFHYLLWRAEHSELSRLLRRTGEMVGFIFVMADQGRHGTYHDHRRRARTPPARSGAETSSHAEEALKKRNIDTSCARSSRR